MFSILVLCRDVCRDKEPNNIVFIRCSRSMDRELLLVC